MARHRNNTLPAIRTIALAKLTRPAPKGVYSRTRLFKLLDQARKLPLSWISAPAGFGKTTLVASYLETRKCRSLWYQVDQSDSDVASFFYCLGQGVKGVSRKKLAPPLFTREYRDSLPIFTANYFRTLFGCMKAPGLLVFDDYQDAGGPDSPLHEVLLHGVEQLPKGFRIVVMSREAPPVSFARLRANERMALIEWKDIKLTEEESGAIARLRAKKQHFSRGTLKELHEQTQGWVAGLVLLTEREQGERIERASSQDAPQPVFDYFAAEIFRRSDPDTQEFLLATAFLPRMSIALARDITGKDTSESILKALARRNYFTLKHAEGSYEYHPLFRAFLMTQAGETYSAEQLRQIKQRSAEMLARAGDMQTAVHLFEQAHDWTALLSLILAQASTLATQGRTLTIEAWLAMLPAALVENHPWALYWKGVCRMAFAPSQARAYFEHAFVLFEQQDDASPLYLAWTGVVESFVLERDDFGPMQPWLDRYHTLSADRTPPSPDIEATSVFMYVSGLLHARFDHPDLVVYAHRAEQLLRGDSDKNRSLSRSVFLFLYYTWKGDIGRAGQLVESLSGVVTLSSATPLTRLYWYMCKVIHAAWTGASEEAIAAANEGLALADATGVHALDIQLLAYGIWSQLCVGNMAVARTLLDRVGSLAGRNRIIDSSYHHRTALVCLHDGNVVRAVEEGMHAVQLAREADFFVGKVVALISAAYIVACHGEIDAGLKHCQEASEIAARMRSKAFMSFCSFTRAAIYRLQSAATDAVHQSLREALGLAREIGLVTPPWFSRSDAATLYAMALDADICTDYVRDVITKSRLLPPREMASDKWPWGLKIYTLGNFIIFRGDAELSFSKKAQKKPVDLLHILIVSGPRGIVRDKLAQLLWPDAEGDMARANLNMTLHRLRKLLGEACVVAEGDQLCIDSTHCWVDVWTLNRLLDAGVVDSPAASATRLLDLYHGTFLDGYDAATVLVHRQALQAKFTRAIGECVEALMQQEQHVLTINICLRGIEADPLAEEIYRRLMECYWRLGRHAEALSVYRRCHVALTSVAGVAPAQETVSLYEKIRGQKAGTAESDT